MLTKDFFLAGKAIFTVSNGKGVDYTYRINRKQKAVNDTDGPAPVYFVALLTGPNNEEDYRYLGVLNPETGQVRTSAKSCAKAGAPPVVAVDWALQRVWAGKPLPAPATIAHAGRCGRCARLLTVPESIETGVGPECSGKGYTKPRAKRGAKPAPPASAPMPFDRPIAEVDSIFFGDSVDRAERAMGVQ